MMKSMLFRGPLHSTARLHSLPNPPKMASSSSSSSSASSLSMLLRVTNRRFFSNYRAVAQGELGKPGWQLQLHSLKPNGSWSACSPWHDVPLVSGKNDTHSSFPLLNYINEIPKGTRRKMEIATKVISNPIVQDVKKGKLREFNYGDIPFNYGAVPQTWEDPHHVDPLTQAKGDNDPVDVVEVSESALAYGVVHSIRIIGALAMIDEGETDWKLLGVSSESPLFSHVFDERSLELHRPGFLAAVKDWFKNYKVPDGKPVNVLAFNEQLQDAAFAHQVVADTHAAWGKLVGNGRASMLHNVKYKKPGEYLWLPY